MVVLQQGQKGLARTGGQSKSLMNGSLFWDDKASPLLSCKRSHPCRSPAQAPLIPISLPKLTANFGPAPPPLPPKKTPTQIKAQFAQTIFSELFVQAVPSFPFTISNNWQKEIVQTVFSWVGGFLGGSPSVDLRKSGFTKFGRLWGPFFLFLQGKLTKKATFSGLFGAWWVGVQNLWR